MMPINFKTFNSKLLLFGEYTVLAGSSAVACPLKQFEAKFSYGEKDNFTGLFREFHQYMVSLDLKSLGTIFHEELFRKACESGMYYSANIPVGYGAGSSGAFTAAVYDAFMDPVDEADLKSLQVLFALIESYFHGQSSGFDPLISYLNQSILRDTSGKLKQVCLREDFLKPYQIYLIDSGIQRKTATYVEIFKEKMKREEYREQYIKPMFSLNNDLIEGLISGNMKGDAIENLTKLSALQLEAFPEMIVPEIKSVWNAGKDHLMKLCGAGGGGFYYLYSKNIESFMTVYPEISLFKVFS